MNRNIKTQRLVLDVVTVADCNFIRELVNTKGWIEFIGDRNIHSDEDSIAYINKIIDNPNFTYWVIRLKENNVPIGVVSFIKRDYLQHFDIGFALLPAFIGNGYAFEAAQKILSEVLQQPGHQAILATTLPHNTNSIKLLQKLGLQFQEAININDLQLQVYGQIGRLY